MELIQNKVFMAHGHVGDRQRTKERVSSMRKKEYVDIPERTDIKAFLYIDRPGTIYINLSGAPKGIVKLIPKRPQPNNDRQGRNA